MADGLTIGIAFVAGVASFFAPCVLPVVPGYLAFVTGGAGAGRFLHLVRTVTFVLGFGIMFVLLGVAIGALGTNPTFHTFEDWASRIGGALIIAFGLHMLGLLRIGFLDRDLRLDGQRFSTMPKTAAAFGLGAAFAIGWSPCVGPILATILVLAGLEGGAFAGGSLLAVYASGLAVPFLVLGVTADRGARFLHRFNRTTVWVERVGGVILIVLGILVFTRSLPRALSLLL